MKQVETIIWRPYPEEKPRYDGIHLVTHKHGEYDQSVYWDDGKFIYLSDGMDISDNIIAFAETPNPYNPEAKTFNFQTALELMKEGAICKFKYKDFPKSVDRFKYINKNYCWYNEHNHRWMAYSFGYEEIEGEWELAE